ncbi:MAG: tol-pal system-associated acyl-CoA thioesterase [Rhodospirillaceae bacterium]
MTDANAALPHRFSLRVYYEDTDAGGIVYYANYLRYAERARTELLRDLGVESSRLMADDGIALTVRHCAVDYRKPAVLDDRLTVETELTRIGGATLEAVQTVRRDDEDLVRIDLRLGCMSMRGGAARMPAALRERLAAYLNSDTHWE